MSNTLRLHAPAATHRHAAAGSWRRFVHFMRQALAPRPHETIDEATLRDLGMSRSELGSYAAEASGRAEMTRLRVLRGEHR